MSRRGWRLTVVVVIQDADLLVDPVGRIVEIDKPLVVAQLLEEGHRRFEVLPIDLEIVHRVRLWADAVDISAVKFTPDLNAVRLVFPDAGHIVRDTASVDTLNLDLF